MSMRIRTSALTALTVAALAAGTVLMAPAAGAAPKAAAPKFLSASQLPPHPTSSWTAGPVTEGFPEALGLCVSTEAGSTTTTGTGSSGPTWTPTPCS